MATQAKQDKLNNMATGSPVPPLPKVPRLADLSQMPNPADKSKAIEDYNRQWEDFHKQLRGG